MKLCESHDFQKQIATFCTYKAKEIFNTNVLTKNNTMQEVQRLSLFPNNGGGRMD